MHMRIGRPARCTAASLVALLSACGDPEPDAYGNFEAIEVTVSAEVGGQLRSLEAREGLQLGAGAVVGQLDTTTLALQRQEVISQQGASRTRTVEAAAQLAVLRAQLSTAEEEHARTLRLYRAEAATAQQLNRSEGEVRVLRARVAAARAQSRGTQQEAGGASARVAQLSDRIRRTRIVNPISGTVLTTFAEPGEIVQAGQALYAIADLGTLILRAYVSGAQLARVRVGGRVDVRVDTADGERMILPGYVTWVASSAEFTPTPIQTRDERTDLVYAVKIRVANPAGALKIGMPADIVLPGSAAP
jgi:HlyD family secretion protein